MTCKQRMSFLKDMTYSLLKNNVPGDFVECGVWKGGNCMLMSSILKGERIIWLYDTFEGMPKPTKHDVFRNGKTAKEIWRKGWCESSYQQVETNMKAVGYDNFKLIKGKVEDTIPKTMPNTIALLRLDTDFYTSTKHELKHLYPNLVRSGVLIVDDYWSWQGSKKAVDEYGIAIERIGTSNAGYLVK